MAGLAAFKTRLERNGASDADLLAILVELDGVTVTVDELVLSKLGSRVKKLKKHSDADVADKAAALMIKWAKQFASDNAAPASGASPAAGASPSSGKRKRADADATPQKKKPDDDAQQQGAAAPSSEPSDSAAGQSDPNAGAAVVAAADGKDDDFMPTIPEGPQQQRREKCWGLLYEALAGAVKADAGSPVTLSSIVSETPVEGAAGSAADGATTTTSSATPTALHPSDRLVRRVCFDVEDRLFARHGEQVNREYSTQLRSLIFNLKNPKNPSLRQAVWAGRLTGDRLVAMTPNELADPEMQARRAEMAEYHVKASMSELPGEKSIVTGMFRCGRCKKRETTYTQAQTRSADEPMTVFVTCLNCSNRWKC